ncbi:alpha/beta hydrolase [bacterium]|nr:alpha/beta hydrolase [bacterium]
MPASITLIHGFGCDSRFWHPQVPHLESLRWLLWVPDLPYHGGVAREVGRSLSGLAGWVAEGMQGQARVLMGHSLGGMIALQIAHEAPTLVRGIVLVDSFPDLALNARYLPEMWVEGAYPEVRQWVEARREEIIARMPQANYDVIWPSVRAFNAVPWLPAIKCPVLGIYGGRTHYRAGEAEVLRQQLRLDQLGGPSEVVILQGAGHFVNLECPQQTNAAIARWVKHHFGAPVI